MPFYSYENLKTGEIETLSMSISEMEEFEETQKDKFKRVITPIAFGDSVSLGVTKMPSDFSKFVLGKIKAANPLGSVEKRWEIAKEV